MTKRQENIARAIEKARREAEEIARSASLEELDEKVKLAESFAEKGELNTIFKIALYVNLKIEKEKHKRS